MTDNILPMKRPLAVPPLQPAPEMSPHDRAMERLITMTNQCCLVALDKSLAAEARSSSRLAAAAVRCGSIAERLWRQLREVGMTLPPELR